ncbi:hypothetical protein PG999_004572 [Apiospora kogelbergensis]|uniref:Cytochrome P450 n=1 Tax=Apiospora kogelbergensis TaxID=1337665 RepID=A0AAW0QZR4_9PEZI
MYTIIAGSLSIQAILVFSLGWVAYTALKYFHRRWRLSSYPLYNRDNAASTGNIIPIHELHTSAKILGDGFATFGEKSIWRVNSSIGEVLILAPEYAEDFRYGEGFDTAGYTERQLPITAPGYDPFIFASNEWRQRISDIILHRMTGSITYKKHEIAEELSNGLRKYWNDDQEWHELCLFDTLKRVMASTTQRIFTDIELCRNDEYIQSLLNYATLAMEDGTVLMQWPRFLHPTIGRIHPVGRKVQRALEDIRVFLEPFAQKRRAKMAAALAEAARIGEKPPPVKDWVGWLEEKSEGKPYNVAAAMMTFSVASFHSTTDFLCQMLCDLARHPEYIDLLKQEAADVLVDHTWTKASFSQLQLLDRCMKESQRMKPLSESKAKRDIRLHNGKVVPEGSLFVVSGHWMHDANHYPNPDEFKPDRHLPLVAQESSSKVRERTAFTSTSPEHLAWGFGKHACPGRFFASAVGKMLLIHILFKYDFKLTEGELDQHAYKFTTKMLVRRKAEEGPLNLDSFDAHDIFDGWAEKEDWEEAAIKFDGAM